MTEERLHEIDQHIADGGGDCNGHTERALVDLVAEVRRLRAERDALAVQPNDKPTWKWIESREAFETQWTILP
jgi:hypothetical protein